VEFSRKYLTFFNKWEKIVYFYWTGDGPTMPTHDKKALAPMPKIADNIMGGK
jgi:hypothetical protein